MTTRRVSSLAPPLCKLCGARHEAGTAHAYEGTPLVHDDAWLGAYSGGFSPTVASVASLSAELAKLSLRVLALEQSNASLKTFENAESDRERAMDAEIREKLGPGPLESKKSNRGGARPGAGRKRRAM